MPAPERLIQGLRSRRSVFFAACLAAGLGVDVWIDGGASSRSSPRPEAETLTPVVGDVASVPADAPPLDPAARYSNLATLISRLEGRIWRLQAEHERVSRTQASYDRMPDYRESTSEVEFRGRMSMDMTYRRIAIEQEIEAIEKQIDEARAERKSLASRHGFE